MCTTDDLFLKKANIKIPGFVKNFSFSSFSTFENPSSSEKRTYETFDATKDLNETIKINVETEKCDEKNFHDEQSQIEMSLNKNSIDTANNKSSIQPTVSDIAKTAEESAKRKSTRAHSTPKKDFIAELGQRTRSLHHNQCASSERQRTTVSVESSDGRQLVVSYDAPVYPPQNKKKLQPPPQTPKRATSSGQRVSDSAVQSSEDKENRPNNDEIFVNQVNQSASTASTILDQSSAIGRSSIVSSGIPRRRPSNGHRISQTSLADAPTSFAESNAGANSLLSSSRINQSLRSTGSAKTLIPVPQSRRISAKAREGVTAAINANHKSVAGATIDAKTNQIKSVLPNGKQTTKTELTSMLRRNTASSFKLTTSFVKGPLKTTQGAQAGTLKKSTPAGPKLTIFEKLSESVRVEGIKMATNQTKKMARTSSLVNASTDITVAQTNSGKVVVASTNSGKVVVESTNSGKVVVASTNSGKVVASTNSGKIEASTNSSRVVASTNSGKVVASINGGKATCTVERITTATGKITTNLFTTSKTSGMKLPPKNPQKPFKI